jgi:EVE domain
MPDGKETTMPHHWIAVACADHVARGREGGFMQVAHGKVAPLRRIQPGDLVTYYAPTHTMGGKDPVQSFVSIGCVKPGEPYLFDMGGFTPYRRDVDWWQASTAPIKPLLQALELTRGKTSWGYAFRFGLIKITPADFALIATAMGVTHDPL